MADFSSFIEAIASPSLKRVAAHWNEARQGQRMPAWSALRPSAIARELPIVWAYKYDSEKDEFVGRLAGERTVETFGKSFRGLRLSDAQPPEAFSWVFDRLKRVVTEPALYGYAGCVFKQLHRYGSGERIMLPLSTDGLVSDGVVGATEYQLERRGRISLVSPVEEAERWLSLAASSTG